MGKTKAVIRADVCPELKFSEYTFQLGLASHALFLVHEDKSAEFHVEVISELCRVAQEIRIFPLLDGSGQISELVGPVLLGLQQKGLAAEIREVDYEFQKGGNAMLRVWSDECNL